MKVVTLSGKYTENARLCLALHFFDSTKDKISSDEVTYMEFISILEIIGTIAFAMSGALLAIKKTAIGAEVAVIHDLYQPLIIIILAVLTGTGGGVIRDVLAKETPYVFQKEVYAVASVLGAILFIIVYKTIGKETALYSSFILTVIIRLICLKKNIHLKKVVKDDLKS